MCKALKYLHDQQIVHGDLKSRNILLGKDDTIKLSEYRMIAFAPFRTIKNFVEESSYLAPEIIGSQLRNNKSDVWALGVLLYEMCALHLPFDAE